jgi:hypothetical protein
MPLPRPSAKESRDEFLQRCMGDARMVSEYDDQQQRYAVCAEIWGRGAKGHQSDEGGGGGGGGIPGPGGQPLSRRQPSIVNRQSSIVNRQSSIPNPPSSIAKVGGTPVSEFLLLPFGLVEVDDAASGESFVFTRAMAERAIERFNLEGRELKIDYEHQTFDDFNIRPDGLSPAAGWIRRLEIRPDGLWAAEVEFTPQAHAMIAAGEYRYFSPTIFWADPPVNTVFKKLGPVGLTNWPAMRRVPALAAGQERARYFSILPGRQLLEPPRHQERQGNSDQSPIINRQSSIVSQQAGVSQDHPGRIARALYQKGGPHMDQIAEMLGLAPGATLEEILAALKERLGGGGAGETATAAKQAVAETVSTIALKLELGAIEDATALIAALNHKLEARSSESAELQTLLKRVGELESENVAHAWEKFLSGPAAGKVTPPMQETVKAIFMRDRKEAEQLVAELPQIISPRSVFAGDRVPGAPLGAADNEAGWKKEWEANRPNEDGVPVQEEFRSVEAFIAFKQHDKAGHVRILGRKAG